jgi:hypothetical protein
MRAASPAILPQPPADYSEEDDLGEQIASDAVIARLKAPLVAVPAPADDPDDEGDSISEILSHPPAHGLPPPHKLPSKEPKPLRHVHRVTFSSGAEEAGRRPELNERQLIANFCEVAERIIDGQVDDRGVALLTWELSALSQWFVRKAVPTLVNPPWWPLPPPPSGLCALP